MMNRLPFPWYDTIMQLLSKHNTKFQLHYTRDIDPVYTYVCVKCKTSNIITHQHHKIPICDFGAHCLKNLIELCIVCHKKAEHSNEYYNCGYFFKWGIRKKKKILLKWYKYENPYPATDIPSDKFVKKHLGLDKAIKYLIKNKDFESLIILLDEWKDENIIKNTSILKQKLENG